MRYRKSYLCPQLQYRNSSTRSLNNSTNNKIIHGILIKSGPNIHNKIDRYPNHPFYSKITISGLQAYLYFDWLFNDTSMFWITGFRLIGRSHELTFFNRTMDVMPMYNTDFHKIKKYNNAFKVGIMKTSNDEAIWKQLHHNQFWKIAMS